MAGWLPSFFKFSFLANLYNVPGRRDTAWHGGARRGKTRPDDKQAQTKKMEIINIKKESKLTIPSDINGLLKSMTRCRSEVIVMGAMAMSAS